MDQQQEKQMKDTYRDIENIIEKIHKLTVGTPLLWVCAWDIARDIWRDINQGGEPGICTVMDEEAMWELFWRQAENYGFTLEYGIDDLYEAIREWMINEEVIAESN